MNNNMFVIEKMSQLLDMPHTKDGSDNLKILVGENFERTPDIKDYLELNVIITQLQYNLQSPQYIGQIDQIKKLSVEHLKRENRYFPECSIQNAIQLLQTLDLYKAK